MNLQALIQQAWEQFIALFKGSKEPELSTLAFRRIKEAADWRTGLGLWSGTLPLFSTRVYYLEVSRTSYADKKELGIKPPPTHTFRIYYYTTTSNPKQERQRITVFLGYLSCNLPGHSEDYIAVEVIGHAVSRRLEKLCRQSRVGTADTTKTDIIPRSDGLRQVKLKTDNEGIPASTLLGISSERTQSDWQKFIVEQMQKYKDAKAGRLKDAGF
jgi:hypothetical protein